MEFRAVGFDLGNTLTYRPGVALDWRQFYPSALADVAVACDCRPDSSAMSEAEAILCRYNARLHARSHEVPADTIFAEILHAWGVRQYGRMRAAVDAFFGFLNRDGCAVYDDVMPVLNRIHSGRLPMGILSDAPSGMPTRHYAPDIALLGGRIDVVLTSVDVGFRKPAPVGYLELARRLAVDPVSMAYVGDEEKDIVGAKAVRMCAIYLNRTGSTHTFGADYAMTSLEELPGVLGLPPRE